MPETEFVPDQKTDLNPSLTTSFKRVRVKKWKSDWTLLWAISLILLYPVQVTQGHVYEFFGSDRSWCPQGWPLRREGNLFCLSFSSGEAAIRTQHQHKPTSGVDVNESNNYWADCEEFLGAQSGQLNACSGSRMWCLHTLTAHAPPLTDYSTEQCQPQTHSSDNGGCKMSPRESPSEQAEKSLSKLREWEGSLHEFCSFSFSKANWSSCSLPSREFCSSVSKFLWVSLNSGVLWRRF